MPMNVTVFWFRRDLRLEDNTGLFHALETGRPVLPLFIFDKAILDQLDDKTDKRVSFIHRRIQEINDVLKRFGSTLLVKYGFVHQVFQQLLDDFLVEAVYTNHDYEPYAVKRDEEVKNFLSRQGIAFRSFKDQVIFEKNEVTKEDGSPYAVFTPFSKKWKALLQARGLPYFPSDNPSGSFYAFPDQSVPSLQSMGFQETGFSILPDVNKETILRYDQTRDIPSIQGTTRLGIHLRFGTISIRHLVKTALSLNGVFLNELIWREFFMQLLWHQPRLVNQCCRPEYEGIRWRNNEREFELWSEGRTGYPIVDAGMRELNETGFMHNRVRMITASFLVKHLLIDWRWGEAYFARKLLDYELASNNGNWQWVAGCGCDAAPYFRMFNPHTQTKRFDPHLSYTRTWVPEVDSLTYTPPLVEHEFARRRCLNTYKAALEQRSVK
jgi:deoxyribodipyrimidine photo-lyase